MNHNLLVTIAKFSVWEAVRDRFLVFILLGGVIVFFLSLFIGELAITEGRQTQAAIMASTLRLFSVFTIGLFVITSMLREFNDKGFELILSHPVPRASYYFGKYAGFATVALIIALMCIICLSIFVPFKLAFLWSVSLFCELLIVISFSLLCLFSFNSITISFSVVMAFYVLSRSIEAIQLISSSPILALGSLSNQFISKLLDALAYLLPELYRFTQTEWLVYQTILSDDIFKVVFQTIVYITLISSAALFDLYRKEL